MVNDSYCSVVGAIFRTLSFAKTVILFIYWIFQISGQLQSRHILTVSMFNAYTAFSPLARIKSAGIPSTPSDVLCLGVGQQN